MVGAQSYHQTGRESCHSRAHLGTASPNTVGIDQQTVPSKEHHTTHQRGSTHPPHWFPADQQRRGHCHSGMLATGPGPCHDDELHPHYTMPCQETETHRLYMCSAISLLSLLTLTVAVVLISWLMSSVVTPLNSWRLQQWEADRCI